MRKATLIVIAAIYVASIVIVGVFGLRALNFEQTIFISDIEMPATIDGKPVKTSNNKKYTVDLDYRDKLEALIDFKKYPRDAQGEIRVTIVEQINYGDTGVETAAKLELRTIGYVIVISQPCYVLLRFDAIDGSKVSKELEIVVL